MTDIRYVTPPDPPDGKQWCVPCLMRAKSRLWDMHEAQLRTWADEPGSKTRWVGWDSSIHLEPAFVTALSEIPQLGPVPVCFTHTGGLQEVRAQPLLSAPGPLPPGLVKGKR